MTRQKGKLVDGAIVAAKTAGYLGLNFLAMGLAPHNSHSVIMRMTIPRPINMWRNQRTKRAHGDNLGACIAAGQFSYGGYHISVGRNGKTWAFIPLNAIPPNGVGAPINGGAWSDDYTSAEDCMRAIDALQ
jgi:hypothetical protein